MRPAPLITSLALLLAPSLTHAQALEPAPDTAEASTSAALFQPAAPLEQAHASDFDIEATRTLLTRLRQENQRLKLQLEEARQEVGELAPLLDERQQWFVTGAGVGVVSFILGLLVTRNRRRREWIN